MSGGTVLETFSYSYNADGQLTSVDNNGTPNVPRVVLSDKYDANSNRTQLAATIAAAADFRNVYAWR